MDQAHNTNFQKITPEKYLRHFISAGTEGRKRGRVGWRKDEQNKKNINEDDHLLWQFDFWLCASKLTEYNIAFYTWKDKQALTMLSE